MDRSSGVGHCRSVQRHRRRPDGPPWLVHSDHATCLKLDAYYAVLSEDETFTEELRGLGDEFDFSQAPGDSARAALAAFRRAWQLPVGAIEDARLTLRVARVRGVLPRIRLWICTHAGRRPPAAPRAISFDPSERSPDEFLSEARQLIREEEANWEREGWRPRHRVEASETALRREARRLYRRSVLRWTWERIAEAEQQETGVAWVDPETIRTSVRRWARALSIRLSFRPGRPRALRNR